MAVNVVSFNKRIPPGAGGSRGTLAEMMAQAKAAAEARNTAMTQIETPTIMQGIGKLAQTFGAGLQERWANQAEQSGREELAKIKAGIGLEGATPQQLAQVGIYDTELEKQLREEAVQARRDKAARDQANLEREDTQTFQTGERVGGQEFTTKERTGPGGTQEFTTGERVGGEKAASTLQDNRLRHETEQADLERRWKAEQPGSPGAKVIQDYMNGNYGELGSPDAIAKREADFAEATGQTAAKTTMRGQDIAADTAAAGQQVDIRGQDISAGTTRRGQDITADTAKANQNVDMRGQDITAGTAKRGQDITADTAAKSLAVEKDKPIGDTAQLMDATERFKRGDWGDPKDPANQAIFQAAVQKNTAFAKGLRISFDENGNPIVEQGGMEGGTDVMDTTAGQKARVASIDEYRADAKAANSALPGVQSAGKVVQSAGYTGPGQSIYGTVDDLLEAGGSMFGLKPGQSVLDTPFGSVGASLPGTATARDIIAKGSLDQVLSRVQETKGAISNAEMETFRKASFGLEKTPESNQLLADMAVAIIQRSNERATRAETWFKSHGGNMAGFEDQEWQPYINANPIIGTDPKTGVPMLLKPGGPRVENAPAQQFPERSVSDWSDEELKAGRQLK